LVPKKGKAYSRTGAKVKPGFLIFENLWLRNVVILKLGPQKKALLKNPEETRKTPKGLEGVSQLVVGALFRTPRGRLRNHFWA